MMSEQKMNKSFADKFVFVNKGREIHDEKIQTKPIGYFKDAWLRFIRNKSALVAFVLIIIQILFAIIVPFFSKYDVEYRDPYYAHKLPKSHLFASLGFWDGIKSDHAYEGDYYTLKATEKETGKTIIVEDKGAYVDSAGITKHTIRYDDYLSVGFVYKDLTKSEFDKLQAYQDENGIQIMYPIQKTWDTKKINFSNGNNGANFWYKLEDESAGSNGMPALENGAFVANYLTTTDKQSAGYVSNMRIAGDDGSSGEWYIYAKRVGTTGNMYRVRVDYHEYYKYFYQHEPFFLFGTNVYGQDIFTCLAAGARLSFALSIVVCLINFVIGACYGAIEGYYGGAADMIMERISDILYDVPFMVVATLFQMHLAKKVGVLPSLLFAFVLTGWVGMAARVRTQFYRFKGHEYVLAARTLGARDRRLIFKHIFPNSLGTIITSSVLAIPGVIFSESILSYLGIVNLETSSMTSIGTLLAGGQGFLKDFPHEILFPALFISILEISFNLFGNGLRDAFNPSLRGAED